MVFLVIELRSPAEIKIRVEAEVLTSDETTTWTPEMIASADEAALRLLDAGCMVDEGSPSSPRMYRSSKPGGRWKLVSRKD